MSDQIPESIGPDWPQKSYSPIGLTRNNTRGFMSPDLIPITSEGDVTTYFSVGQTTITDWRGVRLDIENKTELDTKDRFDESRFIPKSPDDTKPYSTRDTYLIFGDQATDYFRHGLHIIDDLTPIQNDGSQTKEPSNIRLENFKGTPFEHNDPVMFGFDIYFDDITSPLLNGAPLDFINNYQNINEVAARRPVYEDFKNQFTKFFKTFATVRIQDELLQVTKMRRSGYPEQENKHDFGGASRGKKAYLNYYLKKIDGLDKLIERNTPDTKKYLQEYNKDVITLTFDEDLTLSFGTLARLYKLLYWSKPNGKGIIPENLLRFNCRIVISEVRNFNRVRKAISGNKQSIGDLETIKDNVSRYIYDLKECQFYFDKVPHENSVDLSSIKVYSNSATLTFDYKFASTRFERFVPYSSNGDGIYVGYDDGAVWKIGNSRGDDGDDQNRSSASPEFIVTNDDGKLGAQSNRNFVIGKTTNTKYKNKYVEIEEPNDEPITDSEEKTAKSEEEENKKENKFNLGKTLEDFKTSSADRAKNEAKRLKDLGLAKANTAGKAIQNIREILLNNTLNKIANAATMGLVKNIAENGVSLPRNIYARNNNYYVDNTGKTFYNDRLLDNALVGGGPQGIPYSIRFYDVRAQLLNFVGDALGDIVYSSNNPNNPI